MVDWQSKCIEVSAELSRLENEVTRLADKVHVRGPTANCYTHEQLLLKVWEYHSRCMAEAEQWKAQSQRLLDMVVSLRTLLGLKPGQAPPQPEDM